MKANDRIRLTMAQALVRFLSAQRVERDGVEARFIGACTGILGHGNVAGIGQALREYGELRFIPFCNEQAMVHAAVGYARMKNRLGALVCTTSTGPGATNLVTGAALATINRLPVLLLPSDVFARRHAAPMLQQLEAAHSQDVSVNDCLRPVSRYWDRIQRPEQLLAALPEAMRVLASPAETGAVTLALPQDVQTEAYDYPAAFFAPRAWPVPRVRPDRHALDEAAARIRRSRSPLLIAGGGVRYSAAWDALADLATRTGIPVAMTQAGKGSLPEAHPSCLGGVGVTGTRCANQIAKDADLVIGVGTRYSDFTTASRSAFRHPEVRFINLNAHPGDAQKLMGWAVVGDARVSLEALTAALAGFSVEAAYRARVAELRAAWRAEVARLIAPREADRPSTSRPRKAPTQAEVIGALSRWAGPKAVIVNAAGSIPGDLHKLWPERDPLAYQVEYGYSCMGHEIPAGVGVRLAADDRRVIVLVGDGSYLMMSADLVTAMQEGLDLLVVVLNNRGYASIGSLSRSIGEGGFGTQRRRREPDGQLGPRPIEVDFVGHARSLGAYAERATDVTSFVEALSRLSAQGGVALLSIDVDPASTVPAFEAWWDVPVAEVSGEESVREARRRYEQNRERQRDLF